MTVFSTYHAAERAKKRLRVDASQQDFSRALNSETKTYVGYWDDAENYIVNLNGAIAGIVTRRCRHNASARVVVTVLSPAMMMRGWPNSPWALSLVEFMKARDA